MNLTETLGLPELTGECPDAPSAVAAAARGWSGASTQARPPLIDALGGVRGLVDGGLAGLTVAALFAATFGEARGFFLPGIYIDAAYAIGFAASALVGRPLIGTLNGLLYRQRHWRDDARLRRVFTVATFGWSAVYAVRAFVQALLYQENLPGLLAVGKLLLGWPLTLAAVALTLAAVRRATRNAIRDIPRPAAA